MSPSNTAPMTYEQMRDYHRQQQVVELSEIRKLQAEKKSAELRNELAATFASQVPDDIRDATFEAMRRDHPSQEKAINAARRYTNDLITSASPGRNMILTGPPGTGKSHMAVSTINIVSQRGMLACYVSMPHVIRYLHLCVQRETGQSVAHALGLLAAPDVLVIDEIGRHQATDFNRRFVWDLIDARHRARKPIIAATNSGLSELSALLDPAAMSRLFDRSPLRLTCDWQSYRGDR